MDNNENEENFEGEVVTLEYPFEWTKGETISEIKLPRPKAFHVRGINFKKIEDQDADEILKFVQRLSGHPPKFVDKIDIMDIQKIATVVSGFLDSGPETGQTP